MRTTQDNNIDKKRVDLQYQAAVCVRVHGNAKTNELVIITL